MNGNDIRKSIGVSIKEIRTARGLTQEKLAELIEKGTGTIYRIEAGKSYPNSDTLAKLCTALNIQPSVLFSAKPQTLLKEHIDYIKAITEILQAVPQDNLKDIYKILILANKYFT